MSVEVNSHVYAGTLSVDDTTAEALTSTVRDVSEVLIQAASANTAAILVGSSASQTVELEAGDTLRIQIKDVSKVYVVAASGTQSANWIATGD